MSLIIKKPKIKCHLEMPYYLWFDMPCGTCRTAVYLYEAIYEVAELLYLYRFQMIANEEPMRRA